MQSEIGTLAWRSPASSRRPPCGRSETTNKEAWRLPAWAPMHGREALRGSRRAPAVAPLISVAISHHQSERSEAHKSAENIEGHCRQPAASLALAHLRLRVDSESRSTSGTRPPPNSPPLGSSSSCARVQSTQHETKGRGRGSGRACRGTDPPHAHPRRCRAPGGTQPARSAPSAPRGPPAWAAARHASPAC